LNIDREESKKKDADNKKIQKGKGRQSGGGDQGRREGSATAGDV
jgi:hypothetical protein